MVHGAEAREMVHGAEARVAYTQDGHSQYVIISSISEKASSCVKASLRQSHEKYNSIIPFVRVI